MMMSSSNRSSRPLPLPHPHTPPSGEPLESLVLPQLGELSAALPPPGATINEFTHGVRCQHCSPRRICSTARLPCAGLTPLSNDPYTPTPSPKKETKKEKKFVSLCLFVVFRRKMYLCWSLCITKLLESQLSYRCRFRRLLPCCVTYFKR